jgi:hypothetical protein
LLVSITRININDYMYTRLGIYFWLQLMNAVVHGIEEVPRASMKKSIDLVVPSKKSASSYVVYRRKLNLMTYACSWRMTQAYYVNLNCVERDRHKLWKWRRDEFIRRRLCFRTTTDMPEYYHKRKVSNRVLYKLLTSCNSNSASIDPRGPIRWLLCY